MKKILLLAFIAFGITSISAAQQVYVDSLKQELSRAKEDTNKVWILNNLGWYYQWSIPDTALFYFLEGLPLSQKLDFKNGERLILTGIGEALSAKGNYFQALQTQLKTLKVAESMNDVRYIASANSRIGNVYFYSKDYATALIYYYKYYDLAKSQEDFFERSKVSIFTYIGETYYNLNVLDSALFYTKQAYDIHTRDYESFEWPVPYYYMGLIAAKKEQYSDALKYLRNGVEVSMQTIDKVTGYRRMAFVFRKTGKLDSSIYYAGLAMGLAQHSSFINEVIEASEILADNYKALQKNDSAFKYQEILLAAKDSLFSQEKVRQIQNLSFSEQMRRQEIQQEKKEYKNKIRMYALLGIITGFLIIAFILVRSNRHKQRAYTLLQRQKQEIDFQKTKVEKTLEELKSTQAQLIQSEKMASLGELTAGVAHEIQNPLNFVNNFSDVNNELIEEMNNETDISEIKTIAYNIKQNNEKISFHGRRADAIVKGMLQHSRANTGINELTDINSLADEYLRLAYHGFRAKDKSFNAKFETNFDGSVGKINVVPQDIGRVILNLINNAFYSVSEKQKLQAASQSAPTGVPGTGETNYEPLVVVQTKRLNDHVEIIVEDNGNGIPQKILDKIFQPFFTTKPTGQGTGLGLSLAYDIVKAHRGKIKVETKEGEGAEFIIQLPLKDNI